MTVEPEFNIEDTKHVHVVHVLVRIDEQMQYRMGRIEIWGLRAPGEMFDTARVRAVLERNKKILPGGRVAR